MRRSTPATILILALTICAAGVHAQEPADVYKVDYFENAHTTGAPDATVRLTNPGTSGGDICANIFVFNDDEELMECCSCLLLPNGKRKLSVNNDLTSQPLTRVTLTDGSIAIVSSAAPSNQICPSYPKEVVPVPALRAWATHIQDSNFTLTESASQDATLSRWDLGNLNAQCRAISVDSTPANCTCGTGD